ncbi:MAG: hypothetical protein IKH27_11180 [Oscillospiraceae bacterium]|nr:hypothetical protein [Oscillospiraceae bacterium]
MYLTVSYLTAFLRHRSYKYSKPMLFAVLLGCIAGKLAEALLARLAPKLQKQDRQLIGTAVVFIVVFISIFFFMP